MIRLGKVVPNVLTIVAFGAATLISLFKTADQELVHAASESQSIVVLGVDESTGTRFWTTVSQRKIHSGRSMPDVNNPCPFFIHYLVIAEVPARISLGDDDTARRLVEKGKEFAQRGCPSFRISWTQPLKVHLYIDKYDKDKQPTVVAEWKVGVERKDVAMEYRNRALEEKRGRRVVGDFVTFGKDGNTGTQFGVTQPHPNLVEHEPCLFNMGSQKSIVGTVPSNLNLMDDSVATTIAKKGVEEFSAFCPKLRELTSRQGGFRINVSLYSGQIGRSNAQVYVVYNLDASGQANVAQYRNYAQEQARRAEEQKRRAEEMARLQEQQRVEEARIAKENADREVARQERWNNFVRRYGIQEMIGADVLTVNPFAYQGKTVAIHTHFERMVSPDTGLFADGNFKVTGLPRDLFRARNTVVLVGRVVGNTGQIPELKFVGVHFCQDYLCSDLLAQR
jgi:hypothetical protein